MLSGLKYPHQATPAFAPGDAERDEVGVRKGDDDVGRALGEAGAEAEGGGAEADGGFARALAEQVVGEGVGGDDGLGEVGAEGEAAELGVPVGSLSPRMPPRDQGHRSPSR